MCDPLLSLKSALFYNPVSYFTMWQTRHLKKFSHVASCFYKSGLHFIFLTFLLFMNVFFSSFLLSFLFSLTPPGVCSYLTKGRSSSTTWSQRLWWALGWNCCGCQGYCFTPFVWRLLALRLKEDMSNRLVKDWSRNATHVYVNILLTWPGTEHQGPLVHWTVAAQIYIFI